MDDKYARLPLKMENGIVTQEPYGWRKVKPSCLQWLNSPAWFLAFISLAVIAQSMCVNGLIGVTISTLEKRFGFGSTSASLISSFYEFSSIPIILIVGYVGGSCHRPKWIGYGMAITCFGSLFYALPHFTTELYIYRDATNDNLCHPNANVSEYCSVDEGSADGHHQYLYLFIVTTLLFAIGSQPLFIMAVTYIDDSLSRHQSSVYLGIFYSVGSIGPAIAYIGGGFLLDVYTDFDKLSNDQIELTPSDPRWVGAWWVGFLITFVLALLTVVPILGFPHSMHYDHSNEKKSNEVYSSGQAPGDDELTTQPGFGNSCRDLPKALKILLTNAVFVMVTCSSIFNAALINGFTNFGPKYVENQFSISASMAGMIFGVIAVPGAAGGSILGSVLVKKLHMDCRACIRAVLIMSCLVVCVSLCFLMTCDNARFFGVNTGNTTSVEDGRLGVCDKQCECSRYSYSPICASDNLTYFSPCYAGCTVHNDSSQVYDDCGCGASSTITSLTATKGICPVATCTVMPAFIIMFFFAMLFIFMEGMFHIQVVLRVVPQSQRSLAIALNSVIARLLGSVPGTVLFGTILDYSCLLWEKNCDDSGSCLYYNNFTMATYMLALCGSCKVLSAIASFFAWKLYKSKSVLETVVMVEANGNNHANVVNLEITDDSIAVRDDIPLDTNIANTANTAEQISRQDAN